MTRRALLAGLLGLWLTVGCGATQQWVKDYVSRENVSVKTELRERLQPMEQAVTDSKAQVEVLKKDMASIDAQLATLHGKLDDLSKSLGDINQSYKTEVAGVRQDVGAEIKDLQEKVKDLNEKMGRLGTGLLTFQKSIDQLSKRLEPLVPAPGAPSPTPPTAPKK
jgi:chromosome segregation ATPase